MTLVFSQIVFDFYLIKSITNASIAYYGGIGLAFTLMIINEIFRSRNKYLTMVYGSVAAYLSYDAIFSLRLINKPYSDYEAAYQHVHIPCHEFIIFMSVSMLIIHTIFTKWAKY